MDEMDKKAEMMWNNLVRIEQKPSNKVCRLSDFNGVRAAKSVYACLQVLHRTQGLLAGYISASGSTPENRASHRKT